MSRFCRLLACVLASAALLLVACSSGNDHSSKDATATPGAQTLTPASPTSPSPFATEFSGPNESGQAPIFWRTADDFATLKAGQPYKVLFRITNGYAEPTLTVVANCTSCFGNPVGDQTPTILTGVMVTPVGADAPGSYYPVNVLLPNAGHWELTVQAGANEATVPVDVQPAQFPGVQR